ncbi:MULTISPECIES: hypothetical protein [unclassified Bradyrhizobium]|uniref:hypothetical protein n=1 Tax=unclassified Bradyrhizobium TaxID=2631580 RepID=UPI001CD20DAC|nr:MULTISPECIES: hypothetical protein [unclassified Bradyrhizobium]MCA1438433.1 hypothetical protein [Bradyrhizobium sp. BRP20]MCA1502165.1 hypothetical protein [Bradyrhizobium sp. NBAIM14]MCA1552492.1 hypothetical protein [Bradyrhizobium sp. BRP19]
MVDLLGHQDRLDQAQRAMERLAAASENTQVKADLLRAANALGKAEDRIAALEAIVSRL